MNIDFKQYVDLALELAVAYTPKFLLALITLIGGMYLIKYFGRFIEKAFAHQHLDKSLASFLLSFAKIMLKVILLITVAGMIGVQMTSVIALLGAAGLAVGLALQGSLANFAGGVLILTFKPFKVGDFIEAQNVDGFVQEIQIFYTVIKTRKNHVITIPNGELSNGIVDNHSTIPHIRVDIDGIGIGYSMDIDKAKEIVLKVANANKKTLEKPAPVVYLEEMASSSVNFHVRVWVKTKDEVIVKYEILEDIKKEFDKAGINIPFPQRVVHLRQEK